jgi:hypothetical protein
MSHEALRPSLGRRPQGVPCSAFDELVVSCTATAPSCSDVGDVLMLLGDSCFTIVSLVRAVNALWASSLGTVCTVHVRDGCALAHCQTPE